MTTTSNVIPGFEDLTPEQVFTMALEHVLKNGRACMVAGDCSYQGIGCAASVFLTPKARKELAGVWMMLVEFGDVPQIHSDLIRDIQRAHDYNSGVPKEDFIPTFKDAMRLISQKHGLGLVVR